MRAADALRCARRIIAAHWAGRVYSEARARAAHRATIRLQEQIGVATVEGYVVTLPSLSNVYSTLGQVRRACFAMVLACEAARWREQQKLQAAYRELARRPVPTTSSLHFGPRGES